MPKINKKSYSKFNLEDIQRIGLQVIVCPLFDLEKINPILPSEWLLQTLQRNEGLSLNTEKAKSEFIIAPILNEIRQNNKHLFAVYSGFNFTVDASRGLQGFCDFLLARLPLSITPNTPIIAVVEAKLNQDLSNAIPQCAAEMFASRLWNKTRNADDNTPIFGIVTSGESWLFARLNENTIEVHDQSIYLNQLGLLIGTWQHILQKYENQ